MASPSTSLTILSGNGNWTSTSTSPDGTNTVGTYTAGRMVSSVAKDTNGATIQSHSQEYDALNRPVTSTDSRTGVTTTAYLSATADVVKSVTDSGNRTTNFTYDTRGRQTTVDAPRFARCRWRNAHQHHRHRLQPRRHRPRNLRRADLPHHPHLRLRPAAGYDDHLRHGNRHHRLEILPGSWLPHREKSSG